MPVMQPHDTPSSRAIRPYDTADALRIQVDLSRRCVMEGVGDLKGIRYVAGTDAAYSGDMFYAAAAMMTFPGLDLVESRCVAGSVTFPYIPGLFSFREGPGIIEAVRRLSIAPDLLLVNGHGYAHPRRCGIACHVGVILDLPSVGVARKLLTGRAPVPGREQGSTGPITDGDEVIGMAVRTISGAGPVFVSAGHKIDLSLAVEIVIASTSTHRITEPIWHADRLSRHYREVMSCDLISSHGK